MKRMHFSEVSESLPEINLVPLIDVCLVLVVILLMTTPLAFEAAIGVHSAAAGAKQAQITTPEERLELRIVDDRIVDVNHIPVARENLAGTLTPLLENASIKRVVIRCEPGVTHGAFVDVLDQAKSAGAADLAVVGS